MAVSIVSSRGLIRRFLPAPSFGNDPSFPPEREPCVHLSRPTVSIGPGLRGVNSRTKCHRPDPDATLAHAGTHERSRRPVGPSQTDRASLPEEAVDVWSPDRG